MKRFVFKIAVVLMMVLTVMSFAEKAKITIWAWDPNFNIAIMQEAANRNMKINPNV